MIKVARLSDVPEGTMIHVGVEGKEILLANVGGTVYATDDRCGHMNASLAKGTLEGKQLICPMHKSRFDVTTGKKVEDGRMGGLLGKTKPGKAVNEIRTYDLRSYRVVMDGDKILVEL